MRRNVLVTGATGKQGRALIRALLQASAPETGGPEFHVYAVSRNPSSPSAQSLKDVGNGKEIAVVEGNLDVPESITKIFEAAKSDGGIWGVFAVLAFPGLGANASGEERQGKVRSSNISI